MKYSFSERVKVGFVVRDERRQDKLIGLILTYY